MLYTPTASLTTSPHKISGRYLASNKLPPGARAWLAVAILEHRAELTELTAKQVAMLCRASISSMQIVRDGNSDKPAEPMLEKAWSKATPQQRIEFVRRANPEAVWTALAAAL